MCRCTSIWYKSKLYAGTPKMKIELLLLLVKHYARNHHNQLYRRYINHQLNLEKNRNITPRVFDYLISNYRSAETACGVTATGLHMAIGGSAYENAQQNMYDEKNASSDLATLKANILTTGQQSLINNGDNFICYQFELSAQASNQNSAHDIDHIFTVIQYKDAANQLRYCLLQSYANQCSFLEYLINSEATNNSHMMSHDEFMIFIDGLQYFLNAKTFDQNVEQFHQRYFHTTKSYLGDNLGKKVSVDFVNEMPKHTTVDSPSSLNVKCLTGNIKNVIYEMHTYHRLLQRIGIPHIILFSDDIPRETGDSFNTLLRSSTQQNPADRISFLYEDPYTGKLIAKTVGKEHIATIEALQSSREVAQTVYPSSKLDIINSFKRLITEANSLQELQDIFDVAWFCVNQHHNIRWDSFWGIKNTASLREVIEFIRIKAENVLFISAPLENKAARIQYFQDARNMSLFNMHRNNFKITGAFGRTRSIILIDDELSRLQQGPTVSQLVS